MLNRITCFFILPLFLIVVSGCSMFSGGDNTAATAPEPPPAAPPPTSALTSSNPAPEPEVQGDSASPAALADKVAAYRRNIDAQTDKNSASATAAAAPTTQPGTPAIGDANWFTPDSVRLTTYKQDSTPAVAHAAAPPAPADTKDSTAAAAPATGNVSFPVSVPEGADHATADGSAIPASSSESPTYSADQLEHKLAAQLRDYPQDLAGQLDYELLLFVEGYPVPQMSSMSGLRAEDRELLSAVMDGLSNFRSVVRADNNSLLAAKTQPLIDMADRLRSQSELTLPTVALCTSVSGFGNYAPVDKSRFPAGADNKVVVYCEVRNFQSRLSPDNQWQTQLSEEMVLYTESGLPIWPAKSTPQRVTDVCRQKRGDFCFAKLITLPSNLTIGRYLLKITVTDMQANHVAEATTPVEIVAE